MILTNKIKIKTTNKNITHYKKLGYDINSGDIINIPPNHLPNACKLKINVKCDVCSKEKNISYHSYKRNIDNQGYYACSSKCAYEKNIITNNKRFGVDNFTKTEEYNKKTKKTKKEKYGNENYTNIEKQKQTNLKKYGYNTFIKTDIFKEKKKQTMINKYGVEYPLQSPIIKEKWTKTNITKYGTKYPLQSPIIKNKSKETKIKKYNNEHYNNRIKFKNTILELYGVDNPMKDNMIKNKVYQTIKEKYGVNHHMHLEEIITKVFKSGYKIHKYNNTNIYYQGTYKKDFLDKYYNLLDIKRGKPIEYYYGNNKHIYYPDFFISEFNLIVEIKSSHWYNKHIDKNLIKKNVCIQNGYNFLFIIDKNYTIFDNLIKHKYYSNYDVCYQYKIKNDNLSINTIEIPLNDFVFKYIDSSDKKTCQLIVDFIKRYEWLGKMPNRPTHRFIATHNGEIGAVIIMSIPNSFSKLLGNKTKDIERLISRGASTEWTPKNLGSSLIMWSIKWMSKNTQFKVFSAYSDPEAKELGTIYQACNFLYMGQKYGSGVQYFDLNNPNIGWINSRNFRKLSFYKKVCKENNITWNNNWSKKYTVLWDNIPKEIKKLLINESKKRINSCVKRTPMKKHKYVYILGKDKKETKELRKLYKELNPKLVDLKYPKERGK